MNNQLHDNHVPIGVFDSGMGGLTVLRALKSLMPHESFVYLGDTARLPYGTKSPATVIQYAHKMVNILLRYDIKMLVIACNTASAAALPSLRKHFPQLPIIGVIEPGAQAAFSASGNHHYALLATETTLRSEVYQKHLFLLDPAAHIQTKSCGLFVALAEENCVSGAIAQAVVKAYLTPIIQETHEEGCIILGCTHFPVLAPAIRAFIGPKMRMIDSALATAQSAKAILSRLKLLCDPSTQASPIVYLVTDNPERFVRIGPIFLGEKIQSAITAGLESALEPA